MSVPPSSTASRAELNASDESFLRSLISERSGMVLDDSNEYLLTSNPESQPFSLLHSRTHDGSTLVDDQYMESWAYVDGFGRTLVTLQSV